MKIVILLAYAVAGLLVILGDREMNRTDQSPDVRMGGSFFVLAGCALAVLATIALVALVLWRI